MITGSKSHFEPKIENAKIQTRVRRVNPTSRGDQASSGMNPDRSHRPVAPTVRELCSRDAGGVETGNELRPPSTAKTHGPNATKFGVRVVLGANCEIDV